MYQMNSQVTELARKEGELQSLRAQQTESREQVYNAREQETFFLYVYLHVSVCVDCCNVYLEIFCFTPKILSIFITYFIG